MSVRTRLRARLGRYRIQKLAERDLDAFEAEQHSFVHACEEAERAFEFAPAGEVADRRADYLDLVKLGRERLERACDERAETLDASDADAYRQEFAHAVLRRLSRFAPEIEPLDDGVPA
jgi:hypothetical protein